MRSVAFILVAACGGTMSRTQAAEQDRRATATNEQRAATALADWRSQHHDAVDTRTPVIALWAPEQARLFPDEPDKTEHTSRMDRNMTARMAVDVASPPALANERLLRDPGSRQLALDVPRSCGAIVNDYKVFREPNGTVDLVRLRPTVVKHRVRLADRCSIQSPCQTGTPTVSDQGPLQPIALGVTDVTQLAVFDLPYRYDVVEEYCEHQQPFLMP